MNGAECILRTLVKNGIKVCFMNPGTSEMHFVAALDTVQAMRGILCLYEGVCSGAADGYARMKGSPASVLLHLGPGLANALSNLHNARKAHTPLVAIVGEHSTGHLKYDAPLTSDIAAFARTVSHHVGTVESVNLIGPAVAAAIGAAIQPPGQIATVIVPADFSWLDSASLLPLADEPQRLPPDGHAIEQAAQAIRGNARVGVILGGSAIASPAALVAAGQIAAATGTKFFADRSAPRLASGSGQFQIKRVPYFPEDARAALAEFTHLLLVEAQSPVSFFGYPNTPSSPVTDGCAVSILASRQADGVAALQLLAKELGVTGPVALIPPAAVELPKGGGNLTLPAIGQAIAALMPAGTIISDEMVSSREPILTQLCNAPPHDQLTVTGGSIGQGLPVALGAAIACPGRRVIALEGDGSAMYSFQALWTMARENLDVVTVVLANRRYRILDIEMRRTAAKAIGSRANEMLDLGRPELNFVSLARGVGVHATQACSVDDFTAQFRGALRRSGPALIEAVF